MYQTNFDLTLPAERRAQAKLAVKAEYTFDFAECFAVRYEGNVAGARGDCEDLKNIKTINQEVKVKGEKL